MTQKKTIAIDARGLEGKRTGVGRYLSNLLNEWARSYKGVLFRLYFKSELPKDVPLAPWIETRVLPSNSNAMWTHWIFPRAIRKDDANVLFSPWYIAPSSFLGNIPFTVTLHDIVFETHPEWVPPVDRVLLRWVARHSANRASAILTISEFSKSEIVRFYGVDSDKVVVTPLAVDPVFESGLPLLEYMEDSLVPRNTMLFGNDSFILFVGSIFNRRHLPELIMAVREVNPPINLLIVGADYTYPAQQIKKVVQAGNAIAGRIMIQHVNGLYQNELMLAMRQAKAVISLSTYEGFNLPPLEAQSLGTPVILADTPVSREVFGGSALYVKNTNDIDEIVSAIKAVAVGGQKIGEYVRAGRENVRRYSWGRCAEQTLTTLCNIN